MARHRHDSGSSLSQAQLRANFSQQYRRHTGQQKLQEAHADTLVGSTDAYTSRRFPASIPKQTDNQSGKREPKGGTKTLQEIPKRNVHSWELLRDIMIMVTVLFVFVICVCFVLCIVFDEFTESLSTLTSVA